VLGGGVSCFTGISCDDSGAPAAASHAKYICTAQVNKFPILATNPEKFSALNDASRALTLAAKLGHGSRTNQHIFLKMGTNITRTISSYLFNIYCF